MKTKNQNDWNEFVDSLNFEEACKLCGLDYFPHWLAAGANAYLLAEYLNKKYPSNLKIREALIQELKLNRPEIDSKNSNWWKETEKILPEIIKRMIEAVEHKKALYLGDLLPEKNK